MIDKAEIPLFEVIETADLKLDSDTAWERIGDFGAVGVWHPMLDRVKSDGNVPGDLRHATGKDGSAQVERLDSYDSAAHAYSYTLIQTALPVRDYHAAFRIDDAAPGTSRVTWSAQFTVTGDEHQGTQAIRQFLKARTEALAKRYG